MKRVLISLSFALFLFSCFSIAEAQTQPILEIKTQGSDVVVTLSGITPWPGETKLGQFSYLLDKKEIINLPFNGIPSPIFQNDPNRIDPVGGKVVWTLKGLELGTTYHLRVVEFPPTGSLRVISFITADKTFFKDLPSVGNTGFTLSAVAVGTKLTIVLKHQPLLVRTVKPVLSEKIIESVPNTGATLPPVLFDGLEQKTTNVSGTTEWVTSAGIRGGKTYYVRVFDVQSKKFITDNISFATEVGQIFFNKDLKYRGDGSKFYLEGSVDVSKHGVTSIVPLNTITVSGVIYNPDDMSELSKLTAIKLDDASGGKYSFEVKASGLNAGTWYPVTISFSSDTGAKAEYQEKFNTQKGIIPQTGKERDDFFDRNSYRLLAPIPGLVALLDPALCQLEQQRNPGQICDVNAFLNFILKLIIGLAAVVLVVRLIIEGYSYMITDTPFKKAAAKGAFWEALTGLVIALASYLILNTINPKLVNNDVHIGVAEFDIKNEEDLGTDAPWTGPTIGLSGDIKKDLAKMTFPSGVYCPGKTGGSGDIRTVATSFKNKVTYSNEITGPKARGNPGPEGTIYLDCSLYVNVVLGCAGITPKSAPSTASMYPAGERVRSVNVSGNSGYVNGQELHPGDLIGVLTKNEGHHVWIYIGGGEIIDSHTADRETGMSVTNSMRLEIKPYKKIAPMNFVLRI